MLTPAFFAEYWQRQVLWSVPARDGREFIERDSLPAELITLCDIEVLLSTLATPDRNWMQVVRGGAPLRTSAYTTPGGLVRLSALYAAVEAGYTVQLAKMHKRWPAIGRLCRAAEEACLRGGVLLAMRVGSHLYLTPPGSTGLEPHYDDHDVIVVQVEGTKRWRVYGALEAFPVAAQLASVPRDALPSLEHEILLEPGHILYIPRGMLHEASSEAHRSVHVTLDITPCTWADLLAGVMRRSPRLREALPAGAWAPGGAARLREGLRQQGAALDDAVGLLPAVAEAALDRFLDDTDLLPARGLAQIDRFAAADLETLVQRRPGTLALALDDPAGASLSFPGAALRGAPELAAWLRDLAESRPFPVRVLPGPLAPEGKVEVARALLVRGFLELAERT